jgi:hypothetical protein
MPRVTITQVDLATAGAVQQIAVTRLASLVVTALRNGAGRLQVIAWEVTSNGSITRRGDALAGDVSRVVVTDWPQGPGVVTAVRTASGDLKVIAWKVTTAGNVERVGEDTAGPVSELAISSPPGFAGVITPVRTGSGELKVIAWKVSASGEVTRAGDASGGTCSKITATALPAAGGAARIAVALRSGAGNLGIITWAITSAGAVTRLHEAGAGAISDVALTYRSTPAADLISLTRGPSGDLTVIGWQVNNNGSLNRLTTAQGGDVSALDVATWKPDIHTYAVAALRTSTGKLKLIVWRNGADLRRHGELTSTDIQDVAMTTWSGGVVTVARDAGGNLRLVSWRLQPAGIRLLHRVWPAAKNAPGAPEALEPEAPPRQVRVASYGELPASEMAPLPAPTGPDGANAESPPWQKRFFPSVGGVDPMLAVGHQFVVVTQQGRIAFYDRNGNALPSKAGESTNMSATSFFNGFLATTNPDGSPNPDNINLFTPHEINEFYDTRVCYDAPSRRFVILSAARRSPWMPTTRYFAFAVSLTEDPRDGFQQYMTTESNFRDFPRVTVQGDRLLVAHNASGQAEEGDTPILYAFHYPSVRQGVPDPPNWQYYPNDLAGAARALLVSHHGPTGGMTFVFDIRGGDTRLRIAAFPTAGPPGLAPNPVFADATLSSQAPWPGPFGVFRNNTLYLAGHVQITARVPNVAPPRNSIRTIRVPLSTISSSQITVHAAGIVDRIFGLNAPSDDPSDKVTYDEPGLAVNKFGDVCFVYGRTGVTTKQPLFPEVRYSVWFHGEAQQRRSRLLQAGTFQPIWFYDPDDDKGPLLPETVATPVTHAYWLDYATAVVDPVDDVTFWMIHEYADSASQSWKTVVGVVNPTAT